MGLEEDFEKELWRTVDVARENDYSPNYFVQMLDEHGGLGTARRLLAKSEPQEGLFTLYEKGLLYISMEAVVIKQEYGLYFHPKKSLKHAGVWRSWIISRRNETGIPLLSFPLF